MPIFSRFLQGKGKFGISVTRPSRDIINYFDAQGHGFESRQRRLFKKLFFFTKQVLKDLWHTVMHFWSFGKYFFLNVGVFLGGFGVFEIFEVFEFFFLIFHSK